MTDEERSRFQMCDLVVRKGAQTFIEVGTALSVILKDDLCREQFGSFPAYCRERLGYGKSHAYRLIAEAQLVGWLSPLGDRAPKSQALVRPMIGLSQTQALACYEKAMATAGQGEVTAKLVAEAAAEFLTKKIPRGGRRTARDGRRANTEVESRPIAAADSADVSPPRGLAERVKSISKLIDLAKFYHDGNGLNPGRAYNALCELESEFRKLSAALLAPPPQPPSAIDAAVQQDSKGATARAASPAANPAPLPDNLAQSLGALERLIELAKEHTVGKAVALLLDAEAELVRLRIHLAAQLQLPKAEIRLKAKG